MCTNTNETCTRTILLCIKKFGRYKYIDIKKKTSSDTEKLQSWSTRQKECASGGRGKSIGPELCTECFKKCSEKGLLKFGVSLCLKSCRWKRSWWSWIESYGHTNCVITQQWTFFLPFYAFKTTTKSSSTWRACLLILKTFLVRKKKTTPE